MQLTHPPSSSANIKIEWQFTSSPLRIYFEDRGNFIFILFLQLGGFLRALSNPVVKRKHSLYTNKELRFTSQNTTSIMDIYFI
jgi:hypothetical protein